MAGEGELTLGECLSKFTFDRTTNVDERVVFLCNALSFV